MRFQALLSVKSASRNNKDSMCVLGIVLNSSQAVLLTSYEDRSKTLKTKLLEWKWKQIHSNSN